MSAIAAVAITVLSASLQAQSVSSTAATTVNISSVDEAILANEMQGLKVTAKWTNNSTLTGFWNNLGGGTWGINFGNRMRLSLGSTDNTYNSLWKVELFDWEQGEDDDLLELTFEGGSTFGNVLFDRQSGCNGVPALACIGDTPGSSLGYSFDIQNNGLGDGYTSVTDDDFEDVTALYSNLVQLGAGAMQYDLFTKVHVNFAPGFGTTDGGNPDGPDAGSANPFYFRMDTDKGQFSTVPEPSTYALMAAGLAGVFGFARRRRNNA